MVCSSLCVSKTREHFSRHKEVNTYTENPLHSRFFRSRISTGQGMIADEMLDIWCGYSMKLSEGL